MPKSAKQKKEKVTDFTKARPKLGKGKLAANNAVDTTFKARSIIVPHQTIGQEKDISKPTTRRNLTLEEVLQHLKHYNPNTRKDAILGLRELLEGHPHLVESSMTSIIQTCARLMGDEDAEVRKLLISFFSWFLPSVPLHNFRPHVPKLMLFVTSAQTNIFPAIRIDAVRILNILLELTPDLVVQNWTAPESTGSRVLEGFLGLLSVGSAYWKTNKDDGLMPTSSSVTLSSTSQHVVLSSLAKFIAIAVSGSIGDDSSTPLSYLANSFPSETGFKSFSSLICPTRSTKVEKPFCELNWSPIAAIDSDERFIGDFSAAFSFSTTSVDYSIKELGELHQTIAILGTDQENDIQRLNTPVAHIVHLARTLNPILISIWLDVAPILFGVTASSSNFEIEAKLAKVVLRIASCLYGTIFRDRGLPENLKSKAFDDVNGLLNYMSPYLPSGCPGNDLEDFMRSLNFSYCELTSLTALASQSQSERGWGTSKQHSTGRQKQLNTLTLQLQRVGEYVQDALNGELKSTAHPMSYSLTASGYLSLLPTIWSLINIHGESNVSIRLACIKHSMRTPSKSSMKAAATQFVGTLILLDGLNGPLKRKTSLPQEEVEAFREWFQQLPKVLWEIGSGDPILTEIILLLLLRIAQRRVSIVDANTLSAVRSRLIPFFSTSRPDKGIVLGPFVKFKQNPQLQHLALDVALLFLREEHTSSRTLQTSVKDAVKDSTAASYWLAHVCLVMS